MRLTKCHPDNAITQHPTWPDPGPLVVNKHVGELISGTAMILPGINGLFVIPGELFIGWSFPRLR